MNQTRNETILNAREVELRLSEPVRGALADLKAAVHFSKHFDPDVLVALTRISEGKSPSAHDFIISLPTIAEETFRHIQATGDERAREAWSQLGDHMLNQGFQLVSTQQIGRHR